MNRRKKRKKYKINKPRLIISLLLVTLVLMILSGIGFSIYTVYRITKELPELEQKAEIPAQTTKLYASDGSFLADFHAEENREVVPLEKIPLKLRQAVIAIEDERFYQHHGVDFKAIVRAFIENIRHGGIEEGGSTLTQQYVRSIYISKERTYKRKIKEAILALQLESTYSKDKILEKFLNIMYFGHGAYGVEAAAQTFFGKSVVKIDLAEASLLAGMIQSPGGYYSPYKNIENSKKRRNIVLSKMQELGYITTKEADEAKATEITVKELKEEDVPAPYFVQYVKEFLSDKFGEEAVFKGGLRVYTTIDMKMQESAEAAVFSTLDEPEDPSSALVAIEPKTGLIKAMVGGKDFKEQKFNYAVQGKRQTGSSFKTFTLVAAIENGIPTSKIYSSSPTTIKYPGGTWRVSNYGGGSYGSISVQNATIKSVNAVYARLVMDVEPENVVTVANDMGIESHLDPVPSIALGSQEVSPLEMASAYATLANDGIYTPPSAVTKINDASGKTIYEYKPKKKQAISPITAYLTTQILEKVIKYGTGTRAKIGRPAAGKTGTNQEYRDAWFVGYTPNLACAVWIGFPNAQISMKNVHGFSRVSGGSLPAIIWSKFMKPAHSGIEVAKFSPPETGISRVRVCDETGLRATQFCPETSLGIFQKGNSPTKYCNIHKGVEVPNVVGKTYESAAASVIEAKFAVERVDEPNADIPVGKVFSQSPGGGSMAKEGALITLKVSSGNPNPVKPAASFTYGPSSPQAEDLVSFNATNSMDSDGDISVYEWNFGDGTTLSGSVPNVTHRFLNPGIYIVTLKVVDNTGAEDTASVSINVSYKKY